MGIDDQHFDEFVRHLTDLDPKLREFCRINGFTLAENGAGAPRREPCRDLRRLGNPRWLISIYLDRNWQLSEIEPDMEHTMAAFSDYFPPDDPAFGWRKSEILAHSVRFSELKLRLDALLGRALALLTSWSPELIMRSGEKQENFRYTFRDYFPGGGK